MKTVHTMPPPSSSALYKFKKALLLWYFDEWLPAINGMEYYSIKIRTAQMAVSKVDLPNGTKAAAVPLKGEAFGLIMYENYYEKWKLIAPKRANNPNFKIPNYKKDDETTHKWHKTKWSDSSSGKTTGWNPQVYEAFSGYIKHIKDVREADRKNGWTTYKIALELMKVKHNVTTDDDTASNKKQKTSSGSARVEKRKYNILEVSDVETDTDDEE